MNIGKLIADRMHDADVYDLAERSGCSMSVARATLEAEAFSDITGAPLDYHTDWRTRCRFCGDKQSEIQFTCGKPKCVTKAIEEGRS
jgi:hypothetical protein